MKIQENGNVGIGENSPTAKLHVAGNIIASNPTATNHVTTKSYVDGLTGNFLRNDSDDTHTNKIIVGDTNQRRA